MKTNSKKVILLLAVLVVVLAAAVLAVKTQILKEDGASSGTRTFYVDSVNGNDSNKGTSEKKAWKTIAKVNSYKTFGPGDKILFKAGSAFAGPLKLVNSVTKPEENNCSGGSEGKPIVIDMYGTGAKPLIQGSGDDKLYAAVALVNVQYIEVTNLQIINKGDFSRRGIYVTADAENFPNTTKDAPALLSHIFIKNCEIKDIDGKPVGMSSPSKCYGGIIFKINSAKTSKNWVAYKDILIANNYIHDLSRCGLYTHSDFNIDEPLSTGGGEGTRPRLGWDNVVVRNNYVSDVAGDGLVVTTCNAPLMEYNVVARPQRYTASDLYAVGMWPFGSYDPVVQYNESFGNQSTNDGMGFDLDFANKGAVLQYNYSHDNEGGFLLICSGPGQNIHPVARYNISQNDGCIDNSRIIEVSGMGTQDAWIYNNTIYTSDKANTMWLQAAGVWQGNPDFITFVNNIYFNRGKDPMMNDVYDSTKVKIDHNCFFGATPPIDATNSITADPQLVKPGSGTTGGRIDLGENRGNVDGYKLQPTSPCINAGITVPDNGGLDYWGNNLYNGAPDIGAFEN